MSGTIALTFSAYCVILLIIAVLAYRKTQSLSDYILGGRSLGPLVAALSAGASDMSGWLLLGLPGFAYAAGFEAAWLCAGLLLGSYLNWLLVAPRLRLFSERFGDALTLPSYFERRFNDHSGLLRLISAIFIVLFFLLYTSSGLLAGAKLFNTVFALDFHTALILGAGAIVAYTLFGGFLAVSWTDMFQGSLMLLALLIVPLVAWQQLDQALFTSLSEKNAHLLNAFSNASGEPLTVLALLSSLAWGLGYFGQPHILARFKAVASLEDIPKARRIAVAWTALSLGAAMLIGMVGSVFFAEPLADPEKVFMLLVNALFHPLVAGVLLAAILSAIMSTADSQLLVSSSVLVEDIYGRFFHRNPNPALMLWLGRAAVLLIALIAIVLAWDENSTVLGMVAYAWAGFGAAFGPLIILSLYSSTISRTAAMSGIIVGGVTVLVWKPLSGGLFDLYELLPGFVFAFITILLVSRFKPANNTLAESLMKGN